MNPMYIINVSQNLLSLTRRCSRWTTSTRRLSLQTYMKCFLSTSLSLSSSLIGHQQVRGHKAINVTSETPQESRKLTREEQEARQKAMMAKNLPKRKPIAGVKKVVLVASGKGGVGKSTVATNLAVGMKFIYPGKEIALLDADVFGPSLPRMMNLSGEPDLSEKNQMIPLQNYGVKCMSMGFLVKESAPVVWRGLMVMSAIEKLVRGVQWGPSDILFVDMPPGTGDTQLSFAQTVEVDGAVIVTTPQQVAMQDAIKGVEMFRKTNVPVLGCILNMASYVCQNCGAETKVSPKSQSFADRTNIELLGELPFDIEISDASDDGRPIILSNPDSPQAIKFRSIVERIAIKLDAD